MGVARFYHLIDESPGEILRQLIERATKGGMAVAIRATEQARMADLDLALWRGEGFLPHGMAGGPHDADQPVLLVWDTMAAKDLPNRPACLITLDGAPVSVDEAGALERICIVFDGNDPEALGQARAQWAALTKAGVAAEYWNRAPGRWTCQRRHPA